MKDQIWGLNVPVSGPAETMRYLHPIQTWAVNKEFWSSAQDLKDQIVPKLVELGLGRVIRISNETSN